MSYRPILHITPPQGRLNDPNGVCIVGDQLHVFYQHDPGFPHAVKRTGWGHVSTALDGDGVWLHHPDALYPDAVYDAQGCYSGCAVVEESDVTLFYTGNVKRDGERFTSQNAVTVQDINGPMGGTYRRSDANPLIDGVPDGFTAHFRDPHVSADPAGGWRMVVGAQRENLTGTVAVYRSEDLVEWVYAGEIAFDGLNERVATAYMWECPNMVRMRDRESGEWFDVLVFCPQFPESDECGYVVGRLDGLNFEVLTDFTPLDHGHQFYAPQLIPHRDGGALVLGWMGLPAKDDVPSVSAEGWAHCLTFPRQLSLIDGHLHTVLPISLPSTILVETRELGPEPWSAELVDAEDHVGAVLSWEPTQDQADTAGGRGTIMLTVGGDTRSARCSFGDLLFTADACAVEITAGGVGLRSGEVAFSSAVFASNAAPWAALR